MSAREASAVLGELDLHLIGEGRHYRLGHCLGAQPAARAGVAGVRFAVWAPNARRVSVVGDFNRWDGREHPMQCHPANGVWELFIPGLPAGTLYKYELEGPAGLLPLKADPVAREAEKPPRTASIVAADTHYSWNDAAWLAQRAARHSPQAPLSIYELHAASWRRPMPGWDELGDLLIPYVQEMASPTSSCCRSPCIPLAVPGATSRWACSRRSRSSARPPRCGASSTAPMARASAC